MSFTLEAFFLKTVMEVLPPDIFVYIMDFLDKKSLVALASCCRWFWNIFVSAESKWKQLLAEYWKLDIDNEEKSYHEKFLQKWRQDKGWENASAAVSTILVTPSDLGITRSQEILMLKGHAFSPYLFLVVTGELLVWDLNSLYKRKKKEIWRIPLPDLVSDTPGKIRYHGGEWAIYQINRHISLLCIMNLRKKSYHMTQFDTAQTQSDVEDNLCYLHHPTHLEVWDLSTLLTTSRTPTKIFAYQFKSRNAITNGSVALTLRNRVFVHAVAWNELHIYDFRQYDSYSICNSQNIQPHTLTLPQGVKVWSVSLSPDLKYLALVINQSTLWCTWVYDLQDNGVGQPFEIRHRFSFMCSIRFKELSWYKQFVFATHERGSKALFEGYDCQEKKSVLSIPFSHRQPELVHSRVVALVEKPFEFYVNVYNATKSAHIRKTVCLPRIQTIQDWTVTERHVIIASRTGFGLIFTDFYTKSTSK